MVGMLAPVGLPKERFVLPARGPQVGVPPQVVLAFGVEATSRPAGRASVKVMPLKATLAFGLVTVKVNVDVPFTATGLREKLFVMVGGSGMPQPVTTMLSRNIEAPVVLAPIALILKLVVVVAPVVAAAND